MVELVTLSRVVVVAGAAVAVLGGCEMRALVGANHGVAEGSAGNDSSGGSVADSSGGQDTHHNHDESSTHEVTSADEGDASTTEQSVFDVGFYDVPASCEAPTTLPCDQRDGDPWHALGLNCPGSDTIVGSYTGAPEAMKVHEGGLGNTTVFSPREGQRMVILSTGVASHIPLSPADLAMIGCPQQVGCPSTDFGGPHTSELPPPINMRRVSDDGIDCTEAPKLIGTGDCSNTLWQQWINGELEAVDYAELRMSTTVPEGADGLAYEFAFFSAEYPSYVQHDTSYNDMYVAWLESERWTGNISFDEMGNPITANGVFLDYKDAPSAACPGTCDAPELEGFAMEGHAGTKWLVSSAPVNPGDDITMIFAIFDMKDGSYDSAVILDNFEWTCSGAPPFTAPVG